MRFFLKTSVLACLLAVSACNLTEDPELEGISFGASNAIAHNNALQRIDPWPKGVQDTDLEVPAERQTKKQKAGPQSAYGADSQAGGKE